MTTLVKSGDEDWRDYHKRAAPLPSDIALRVAREIAGHDEHVLLLGVTRDYAELGADLTAVDWCREQIDNIWIGDRPDRRAVLADWRFMDLGRARFTAAIGDGSLSTLVWPQDYRLALERVAHALSPGGLLVVRCFVAPDEPESIGQIVADVLAGRVAQFRTAKWRLAMAVAGVGNVRATAIHDAFESAFPDREALSAATGWSLETIAVIDAYRNSKLAFSFVTRRDLVDSLAGLFVSPRFVSSGDYLLSERYPLLVAERRA